MKNLKKISFLILVFSIIVPSCTIEKRLHLPGYHIEWKKRFTNSTAPDSKDETSKTNINQTEELKNNFDNSNVQVTAPSSITTVNESDFQNKFTPVENLQTSAPKVSLKLNSKLKNSTENVQQIISKRTSLVKNKSHFYAKKKVKTQATSDDEGKSQVVALVLVLLVGFLGIHRFYLGYTGIGILMILTGGCCGILVLIDLIMIVMGTLKPKDGEYTEKL